MSFQPDYRNFVQAARNETPARIPLYDHKVGDGIISKIMGEKVGIGDGSAEALSRYFELYDRFFLHMGYDTVTFEGCITRVLPGGALGNHADPAIKTREDFEKYPFDKVPALYAERFGPQFDALRAHMPEGMKAIGGVDTDHLVRTEDEELVKIVRDVYEHCKTGHGGIAIGSGNSIPDYVDVNKYVLMTRTVRECRGDKL